MPEHPEDQKPYDPVKDLCDLLAEGNIKMVFWVCSDPSHRGVKWNESKTVATCEVCGQTNAIKNEL